MLKRSWIWIVYAVGILPCLSAVGPLDEEGLRHQTKSLHSRPHPRQEEMKSFSYPSENAISWIDSMPLEDRIRYNLARNPVTSRYANDILITVYDGIVIIEGQVRFSADRSQIQAVVQQTNGVYRVDNRLTLLPLRRNPPSQRSNPYVEPNPTIPASS